ncbi:MAG: histidinol-phosphatase [Pseudomonadota bacterium]
MPQISEEFERVAHLLADAADAAILPYFRAANLDASNKDADGGFDPVTLADREAEEAMRAVLARERPDDAILGEEFGHQPGSSGYTWVLDPIDGTRAFICGTPTWGVLIAVNSGAAPLVGMIAQPHIQERFVGTPSGAYLLHDGRRRALKTRKSRVLDEAHLLTTFPEIGSAEEKAAFDRVEGRVRLTRYGLDCYGYGLIATGQVDLVIEAGLNAYDIQGPMAVIEAAGGVVTTWDGGPAEQGGRILAAGSREIWQSAMELLNA